MICQIRGEGRVVCGGSGCVGLGSLCLYYKYFHHVATASFLPYVLSHANSYP